MLQENELLLSFLELAEDNISLWCSSAQELDVDNWLMDTWLGRLEDSAEGTSRVTSGA